MTERRPTKSGTLTSQSRKPSRQAIRCPHLFVVLRADDPFFRGSRHALAGVRRVEIRRGDAHLSARVEAGPDTELLLTLQDRRISSRHAVVEQRGGDWWILDEGSKNGTFVDGERVERQPLADGAILQVGHTFLLFRTDLPLAPETGLDTHASELRAPEPPLRTLSPNLTRQFEMLADVAASSLPVLLGGESGTGKELVARAVHRLSGRNGAFVAVNCGALPPNLVEAELFGFRKGSFSGAVEDRIGLIRSADGGTLFLDEIGNMPLSAQATLLRVLQEREVMPVGTVKPVPLDLRVISATHTDLSQSVERGSFRSDLLARLSGFQLRLPSLSARREDTGLLVSAILSGAAIEEGSVRLAPEAARRLLTYAWPSNIRELEASLRLGVVLAKDGSIELEHLFNAASEEREVASRQPSPDPEEPSRQRPSARPLTPEDLQRRAQLEELLRAHRGNVTAVARSMGKARVQIQRWIKRYGLDRFDAIH